MFEQVMVAEMEKGHRAWTTMLGMAGQTLLVAGAVLVPLISPQALPRMAMLPEIFTIHAPAPPPPPHVEIVGTRRYPQETQVIRNGGLVLPVSIPEKAAVLVDPPPEVSGASGIGVPGGVPGGVDNGVPGGILNSILGNVPAPKPPVAVARPAEKPPEPPAAPERVRMVSKMLEAKLIHKVMPVYPMLAKQARISGVVELVGVVGIDGRIRSLQVVNGHPLLVKAALDAVSQWVYSPTQLNDKPVEVVAPITVTFVLNR